MSRRRNKPIPPPYEKFFKSADNNAFLRAEAIRINTSKVQSHQSNIYILVILVLLLLNQKRPD